MYDKREQTLYISDVFTELNKILAKINEKE